MIDKFYEVSLLYDFYGSMLTEKQKEIVELYYGDDLSLGEISESLNISRQGVYDLLKRSEKQLYHYEEKLRLVEKFMEQKRKLKEAYALLDSLGKSDNIARIKEILVDVLETDIADILRS